MLRLGNPARHPAARPDRAVAFLGAAPFGQPPFSDNRDRAPLINRATALPQEVRDLARRLGATGDESLSSVMLTQRGTMRDRPAGRGIRFRASQTIDLRQTGFEWRAAFGPFGCISITDALKTGAAELSVRAFRHLRIGGKRNAFASRLGPRSISPSRSGDRRHCAATCRREGQENPFAASA